MKNGCVKEFFFKVFQDKKEKNDLKIMVREKVTKFTETLQWMCVESLSVSQFLFKHPYSNKY